MHLLNLGMNFAAAVEEKQPQLVQQVAMDDDADRTKAQAVRSKGECRVLGKVSFMAFCVSCT